MHYIWDPFGSDMLCLVVYPYGSDVVFRLQNSYWSHISYLLGTQLICAFHFAVCCSEYIGLLTTVHVIIRKMCAKYAELHQTLRCLKLQMFEYKMFLHTRICSLPAHKGTILFQYGLTHILKPIWTHLRSFMGTCVAYALRLNSFM